MKDGLGVQSREPPRWQCQHPWGAASHASRGLCLLSHRKDQQPQGPEDARLNVRWLLGQKNDIRKEKVKSKESVWLNQQQRTDRGPLVGHVYPGSTGADTGGHWLRGMRESLPSLQPVYTSTTVLNEKVYQNEKKAQAAQNTRLPKRVANPNDVFSSSSSNGRKEEHCWDSPPPMGPGSLRPRGTDNRPDLVESQKSASPPLVHHEQ